MSVTIREVARQAGVSVATVSRAFTGSGPVGARTRERIMRVAEQLRYVPNGAARSLTTSRTHTLGVLLPDLYGEFFSEVIRGIDGAARQQRYHLLVSCSHDDSEDLEAALRAMVGRVDGLIVMWPDIEARALEANLPRRLPVVLLNATLADAAFDSLTVDNVGGAFQMTSHLLEHGHERVALIRGAEGNHDAAERQRGYRQALAARSLTPDPAWEFAGDFTELSGYEAARRILAARARPSAVFAANDAMAIGALRAFREAGLRVPDDIAVAGFDDVPVARYVSPALSSVHVAISQMGARAVELLLAALTDGEAHARAALTLPTRLVPRESCGCRSAS